MMLNEDQQQEEEEENENQCTIAPFLHIFVNPLMFLPRFLTNIIFFPFIFPFQ